MASYKLEHQMFVTGHGGTSYLEVAMISSISCIVCLTRNLFMLSDLKQVIRPGLFTDLILLVLPNIIVVTLLNNYIGLFLLLMLFINLVLCLHIFKKTGHFHSLTLRINYMNISDKRIFITYFRSIIILCTAVAILAVDFPVFPRRLAKTETFGFGGMDAGVGFFVVSNAIVSSEARGKCSILPVWSQLKKSVTSTFPLLIFGLARLFAVKGSDYHEHVTEYGVHWNFFFTLAALKVIQTLIYCILPVKWSTVGAVIIIIGHQVFLSCGLSSYIVNGLDGAGGRFGYFDANREGICSLPGYLAMYMFSVELGSSFFQQRQNLTEWLTVAKHLSFKYTAYTMIMAVLHSTVEPVSRRFANAAFIFWVMSLSNLMILECLLADIITSYARASLEDVDKHDLNQTGYSHKQPYESNQKLPQRTRNQTITSSIERDKKTHEAIISSRKYLQLGSDSCLLEAIGFNSLLYFLLANLLTGAINVYCATIHSSDYVAVAILIIYMFILSFVVVSLWTRNISTKLW